MRELRNIVRWATRAKWGVAQEVIVDRDRAIVELLWRNAPYQIERVTLLPNVKVEQHRHPNVESWEIYLTGSGTAHINKHVVSIDAGIKCPALFIPRGAWHGGEVGASGGTWLSVQRWTCAPTSINRDWEEREAI